MPLSPAPWRARATPPARGSSTSGTSTSTSDARSSSTSTTRPCPVRRDAPAPVGAWEAHTAKLRARWELLEGLAFHAIPFSGPGTDLTVGLLPEAPWMGGGISTVNGTFHVPNLPTEEVFTSPDWRRTEGTVRSTRPLQLGGTIVRDLEMR